jgi:flagellar protein FlgJ
MIVLPGNPFSTPAAGKVETAEKGISSQDAKMLEAGKSFEAMFLSQFVDEMLKTVPATGSKNGFAEDMWRSFMAQALADELVGSSGSTIVRNITGVADAYKQ